MYVISSTTDKYNTSLSIIAFSHNDYKILDYIEIDKSLNSFDAQYDLRITDDNIIYHINKKNTKFGFYKVENELIEHQCESFEITKLVDYHYQYVSDDYDLNEFNKLVFECMKNSMTIVDRRDIADNAVLFITSTYPYTYTCNNFILIINKNTEKIKKISINNHIYEHTYHYDKNELYTTIVMKTEFGYYCLIIKINIYGDVNITRVLYSDIIAYFDQCNYDSDLEMHVHENLIMIYGNKNNYLCIYDHIINKKIIDCKMKNIGIPYRFVKLKEIRKKELSNLEKIYNDEKTKDINIETNNKIVKAHKLFLINACDYFKNVLSSNYFEINTIKFDICSDFMEDFIKYVYTNNLEIKSIKQLLAIYKLCDEILYNDLKDKVGNILLNDFCLNYEQSYVKISNKKFLEDLPDSITTIIFDRNFNENIDGLINENIEKIIFGINFNQKVSVLPENVKIIEFGKYWNCDIGDLPDTIEILHVEKPIIKKIKKYPNQLKKLIININSKEDADLFKLGNVEISYNYNLVDNDS